MAKDLVSMCCECKKIRIGNMWIGEEHPSYPLLSKRLDISDDYCPACTELYQKQVKQRRERINSLGY